MAVRDPAIVTQREVTFGAGLRGTLTEPADGAPAPCVVMLHDFGSQRNEFDNIFATLAHEIAQQYVASLRFDFPGCGESPGDVAETTAGLCTEAALAALRFVRSEPGLDGKRIGVLGYRFGAAIAAACLKTEGDNIPALALWSPIGEPKHDMAEAIGPKYAAEAVRTGSTEFVWRDRTISLKRQFFDSLADLSPIEDVSEFKGDFFLVVGGRDPLMKYLLPFDYALGHRTPIMRRSAEVRLAADSNKTFQRSAHYGGGRDELLLEWTSMFLWTKLRPYRPRIERLARELSQNERLIASIWAAMRGYGSFQEIARRAFDGPPFRPESTKDHSEFRTVISALTDMIQSGEFKNPFRFEQQYPDFFRPLEQPQTDAEPLDSEAEIATARRAYAEELRIVSRMSDSSVIEAFARVPREAFFGPGPWLLLQLADNEYWSTEEADPRLLYHNVLVAIDPVRRLNNGEPSFWARLFDRINICSGQHVIQVGAGTGYYTAILAEIVGPGGLVTAYEIDPALAERAARNLEPWRQVQVRSGDGCNPLEDRADAIIVCAGATHPLPAWLDRLSPYGGRLLLPLTTPQRANMVLAVARHDGEYNAASLGWVGIFECAGARDPEAARRLAEAMRTPWPDQRVVLRRGPHDKTEQCWLHGEGYCFQRAEMPQQLVFT